MVYIKCNLGPENVWSQNSLKEMSFLQNEMDPKRLLWTWIFRKWQKILKKFGTTQTYWSICVLRSEKIFFKKIFEICFFYVIIWYHLVMHERHFYRSSSGPSLKKFGPVLGLSVPGPTFMQHYSVLKWVNSWKLRAYLA